MSAALELPVHVLGTEDREAWHELLRHADFYHTPAYHELAESRGEGAAKLFVCREDEHFIALPLLLRPIGEWQDATSVYGYAGPIASGPLPPHVVENFRHGLRERLLDLDVVTVFSRLHPLLPQREILASLGECVRGGQTVSIDLTLPLEAQRAQFRGDHKRGINRNRRQGFTVAQETGPDALDRFCEIYTATMRRVSAAGSYFFDRDYFHALAARLGPDLRVFLVRAEGEPICGGLFVTFQGIVQYHLGGTTDDFLEHSPMKLLFDEVRLWAAAAGCETLHLGGGVGSQADSLFHFKAGFSDRRHDFHTWRWVLDPERCAALCPDAPRTGYFPPYRSPS